MIVLTEGNFKNRVEAIVSQIPRGRVMSYGQIAILCGNPRASRIVGGIAHFGNSELPWHRVVNKSGGLASGFPGGKQSHKRALEDEGIVVTSGYQVDMSKLLWRPQ